MSARSRPTFPLNILWIFTSSSGTSTIKLGLKTVDSQTEREISVAHQETRGAVHGRPGWPRPPHLLMEKTSIYVS